MTFDSLLSTVTLSNAKKVEKAQLVGQGFEPVF